jgi:hypothetical protein
LNGTRPCSVLRSRSIKCSWRTPKVSRHMIYTTSEYSLALYIYYSTNSLCLTPGLVLVDEGKLSSSKDYTCIMVGAYTKALLRVHVEVIRKVLTRYPLFLAKRQRRKQRRSGTYTNPEPVLSPEALNKVDVAWKKPLNDKFLERLVTHTPLLSPSAVLDTTCTQPTTHSQSVHPLHFHPCLSFLSSEPEG